MRDACQSPTEVHDLFIIIKNEHALYRKKIDEALSNNKRSEILSFLLKEVEDAHHFREETLLYPLMHLKPKLKEGGPFCTLYFDEHIFYAPARRAKAVTGRDPGWAEHQLAFKTQPSPLDIPLEEHRSMRHILEYLISNQDKLAPGEFNRVFDTYVDLLMHHTQKEEHCFFRVCQGLLTKDELDKVANSWHHSRRS